MSAFSRKTPKGPAGWLGLALGLLLAYGWLRYGHRALLERYGTCATGHFIIRMPDGAFRYRYTLAHSNYFFDYHGPYARYLCVRYLPLWPNVRIVTGPAKEVGDCGCG